MNKQTLATFTIQQIQLPVGVIPAGYIAWMTLGNSTVQMQQLPEDARSCVVTITTPGTYVVRVVRVDASGNSIGPAAESEPFVVSEDQLMVDVPLTVTVSVPVDVPAKVMVR